ncbi:hypothetical protein EDB89DRAFT_1914109 [Lactarius sanguifluus]|nr:hypothetical protein EDB89DRAFT_1914109 [Lactarius sanguifluus]
MQESLARLSGAGKAKQRTRCERHENDELPGQPCTGRINGKLGALILRPDLEETLKSHKEKRDRTRRRGGIDNSMIHSSTNTIAFIHPCERETVRWGKGKQGGVGREGVQGRKHKVNARQKTQVTSKVGESVRKGAWPNDSTGDIDDAHYEYNRKVRKRNMADLRPSASQFEMKLTITVPFGMGLVGSSSNTSDPPPPSGPSSTNSTTSSEANPLNNATGTEDMPTPGRAAASTLNPPRVTLRLGPAKNPTSDAARTATNNNPSCDNHTHAKTKGKKRSADGNPSMSSKKQKRADAMAEPTNSNSIRNICMRQWNGTQPGGQGLLCNFDSYFKTLSEVDKKSFRAAQVAARKVKTAANRATGTTNGD